MPQTISSAQIQQLINTINYATDASSKQSAIENTYTFLKQLGSE
jgi:hypothetical protein